VTSHDALEQRRREVEQARDDLTRSIDQLGTKAMATRDDTFERVKQAAVPIAVGVAGFVVARALVRRRRRKPILEIGPFTLRAR
jgi:uncharacterized membrane protein YoaK (UPF0700 family)